jgi:hypothetical protein
LRLPVITALGLALLACGAAGTTPLSGDPKPTTSVDPNTRYGPLGVGADYESYTKVSKVPHLSQTHGQRFVEIYVNETGLAAYTSDAEFPVGTTIVKTSWERDGDQPSDFAGPIFVMQKREAGFAPDHEDWYYAIHWAEPTPKMAKRFGGPFYWQSPSKRVSYCWSCHEDYDREVGLPPKEARTWVTE